MSAGLDGEKKRQNKEGRSQRDILKTRLGSRQTDRWAKECSVLTQKLFSKIDFNPQLMLSRPVSARFQFLKDGGL